MKEKKDRATLEAFFSLSFFSFSSAVTHAFPSPIKGKAGRPMRGIEIGTRPNHEIKTQKHNTSTRLSSDRALNTRLFLSPETRDHFSLSSVCNHYCKPNAGNTSSSELDERTFSPNQYKPLCPPSTLFKPDVQIQIYLSVVRKHRQYLSLINLLKMKNNRERNL